jgi:hypothetical protein
MILAIDPGPTESGWCEYGNGLLLFSGVYRNDELAIKISLSSYPNLYIEMISSYGMPVGKEVFETCVWIGRFIEAFAKPWIPMHNHFIYRKDVKSRLCGTTKAKDANVRQALIDKLGPVGTKGSPGPLYGVKSHAWAALAVAVTAEEANL